MNKISTKLLFIIMAAFAFVSVISFFQVNSYWADTHHFNGGWKMIGIITGLIAAGLLFVIAKRSGSRNLND